MANGLSSPLRFAGAGAAVVAGLAQVLGTGDHFQATPYLGVAVNLHEVALLAIAVLLVHRDTAAVWASAGALGLLAIGGYALIRSASSGVVSVAAELLLTGLAGAALWRATRQPVPGRPAGRLWQRGAGLVVIVLGLVASGGAATAAGRPNGAAGTGSGGMAMSADGSAQAAGFHGQTTRTYYLSADEVVWDYAPLGSNGITGAPFDEHAGTYVTSGPGRIGAKYLKCLYRGYTDSSFSTLKQRGADEAYLGLLGPVIRAVVGDTIKVVYRNTCSIPTSVHPHGVFYGKDSEGAPYADGTSGADKADDAVPTGGRHTYTWQVPERAGPGPNDGSSVMWMYHSHTDEIGDTYAGLMGPMVVTRAGSARADGTPKDVDQEAFAMFSVMNENNSPYLDANVKRFAGQPYPAPGDEGFEESNLMHSVNGYVFGNMPMLKLHKGKRVRWYVMSMGTEVDLHTPHWHGNTVTVGGMRMDVVNLLPASMVVADMVPDDVGVWLFHCHVNDHIAAGMLARYQVLP